MNVAVLLLCGLTLQARYDRLLATSLEYPPGGAAVLKTAYEALFDRDYELVEIEDLWAVALKEGKSLFNSPRLWSATPPEQTGDMLGQTTIGPWQITLQNARQFGSRYGISSDWGDANLIPYLETRPNVQARLAADLLEAAYKQYGRRTPYALQSYFWLEGFLQKKIGQGKWYDTVLGRDPVSMRNTGFYAKQLLLGSPFNRHGLLYWLYITRDESAIRQTLQAWTDNGYPITADDLNHCACDPAFRNHLLALLP